MCTAHKKFNSIIQVFKKLSVQFCAKSLFDFMCQVLLLEEKSFHVQKSLTLSKSS
jgi:hypothetical protein